MEKLKIKSLGIFDEQKFKKIGEERNNWLESGSDMILNNNSSKIKEMKDSITPSRIIVSVKKVLKENENYKMGVYRLWRGYREEVGTSV